MTLGTGIGTKKLFVKTSVLLEVFPPRAKDVVIAIKEAKVSVELCACSSSLQSYTS
jgi:hypothetical protein